MILETQRFGAVTYDVQDEIQFASGLMDDPQDTRWLLLADQCHPSLYWLQSVGVTSRSFAVCAVSPDIANSGIRLQKTADLPDWVARTPVVAVAPLMRSDDGIGIALSEPILVDPRTRQGAQATANVDQTLQREWSEKVAPLRECA